MFNKATQHIETINLLAQRLTNLVEWEKSTGEVCTHPENWPTVVAEFPEVKPLYLLYMTEDWTILEVHSFSPEWLDKIRPANKYLLRGLTGAAGLNYTLSSMVQKLEVAIMSATEEEWGPGSYDVPNLDWDRKIDKNSHYQITLKVAEGFGVITGSCYGYGYRLDLSEDKVVLTCVSPY
jgi:hypothetical protein